VVYLAEAHGERRPEGLRSPQAPINLVRVTRLSLRRSVEKKGPRGGAELRCQGGTKVQQDPENHPNISYRAVTSLRGVYQGLELSNKLLFKGTVRESSVPEGERSTAAGGEARGAILNGTFTPTKVPLLREG